MSRLLPLAVVQAEPLPITTALADFPEQVATLVADFPTTRMAIYPELHLFGVGGRPAERDQH